MHFGGMKGKGMSDSEASTLFSQFRSGARGILTLPQSVLYSGGTPLQVRARLLELSDQIESDMEGSKPQICMLISICMLAATLILFGPLLFSRVALSQDLKVNPEASAFIRLIAGMIPTVVTVQGATKNSVTQALPELGVIAESSNKPNPTLLALPLKANVRALAEDDLAKTLDPNGTNVTSQGARAAAMAQAKVSNQVTTDYGGANIRTYLRSIKPLLERDMMIVTSSPLAVILEVTVAKMSDMIQMSSDPNAWAKLFAIFSEELQIELEAPLHTLNKRVVAAFLTNSSMATNLALSSAFQSATEIGTQRRVDETAENMRRLAGAAAALTASGAQSSTMESMQPQSQHQLSPQQQQQLSRPHDTNAPLTAPFNAGAIQAAVGGAPMKVPEPARSVAPLGSVAPPTPPIYDEEAGKKDMEEDDAEEEKVATPAAKAAPAQPNQHTKETMEQMLRGAASKLRSEPL